MELRLIIDAPPALMAALTNIAGALRGLSTPAQHTQPSAPVMTAPMSSVTQTKDALQTVVTGGYGHPGNPGPLGVPGVVEPKPLRYKIICSEQEIRFILA